MSLNLGSNPIIDLVDLGFEEANVSQGEVQDTLNRQSQRLIEREALFGDTLEFASVVKGIREMVAAEFVQMHCQVLDR